MNFDRVAPHYRWLETIAFGHQLQRARMAFVRQLDTPRRALVVGEGNGRFLAALLREHRALRVDCVEASAQMIVLARGQVGESRVTFIHADLRTVALPEQHYDLIVTHFFFDCFAKETLAALIAKLADSAAPHAQWLVADFFEPAKGWRHLPARFLIAGMYSFFRTLAGIEARRLVDYRPFLQGQGFMLTRTALPPNEMIRSELWRRRWERTARPQLSS